MLLLYSRILIILIWNRFLILHLINLLLVVNISFILIRFIDFFGFPVTFISISMSSRSSAPASTSASASTITPTPASIIFFSISWLILILRILQRLRFFNLYIMIIQDLIIHLFDGFSRRIIVIILHKRIIILQNEVHDHSELRKNPQ